MDLRLVAWSYKTGYDIGANDADTNVFNMNDAYGLW